MRKVYIFSLIGLAALIIGLAWADQMTISTYYPAPYGVYREMVTAHRQAIGDVNADGRVDSGDMAVDNLDQPIPGSLTVAGDVGIGTASPQAPAPNNQAGNLDVNDVYLRSAGVWLSQLSSFDFSFVGRKWDITVRPYWQEFALFPQTFGASLPSRRPRAAILNFSHETPGTDIVIGLQGYDNNNQPVNIGYVRGRVSGGNLTHGGDFAIIPIDNTLGRFRYREILGWNKPVVVRLIAYIY